MVKKFIFLVFALLLITSVAAEPCLYYFYGEGCHDCESTTNLMQKLTGKYPNAQIRTFEVYYTPSDGQKLRDLYENYGVPLDSQGLPALFFEDTYLIGKEAINNLAQQHLPETTQCPGNPGKVPGVVGENLPLDVFSSLSFSTVTAGGLLDAFHPGVLALLLIMIMFLIKSDKQALIERGLFFAGGIYLTYLIFSYGLFTSFALGSFGTLFYRGVALFAILYGITQIKNFLSDWRLFRLKASKQREVLMHYIKSKWGMMVLGFILALPSLKGVSTNLLSMRQALQGSIGFSATPIILYHLLIIISPLLISIGILYYSHKKIDLKSEKKENADIWQKHHHKVLQVIVGAVVLILGIVLLFM